MQRAETRQSRGIRTNEKRRMEWLKERARCSGCGRSGPVINHHCVGSSAKIRVDLVPVMIGHAFVLGLCQRCDDLVTKGSKRRLVETLGATQSELWLWQESLNPDPAPEVVIRAIALWGEKYEGG